MIQVIKPGHTVSLFGDEILAIVLKVCIEEQGIVTYQVSWWSGRERKTAWVHRFEVTQLKGSKMMEIGFS